ncbi:MAG: M6 family metalloprotease domain-containing protein [Paludibacteraceae bacterium]|nr:M6 family metalloprotease domain-containing protein [Paludibacteraceae bacterium]
MKKIFMAVMLCALAIAAYAVPARRGWQTRTQADGSTIEVQVIGDEFYHYTINRDGKQVREINGMYVEVGEAPSAEVAKARRAKGVARRQRKDVGTEPNLAPKGVVILANFSDKSMQSGHTQTTFDELCNSTNCTVNSGYPSAAQYFADQSNGTYRPQFDVFGPVTLSRNLDYYGHNIDEYGNPTDESNDDTSDQYATDAVVEACILANQQFDINWADYDSDNDGYVDFVYVIYAGQGEADGGAANTIWPHNWEIESAIYYGNCTYTATQCRVDGKKLNNYAMSGELSGSSLSGIGTLCHEFGHVMGLPDFYDTKYGTNYEQCLTPSDWDVMDGGAYGGDGHCPPNYSPWEKEFFGWHTTVNLGNEGQNVTLYANGTENYQAYQITSNGNYVGPTTAGLRYYIENRQAVGWDEPLTGHGMLIWKVTFNATKWTNNEPNNTANNPYYTIVSASGSKIGWDSNSRTDNCPKNPFPGTANVYSYSGISGKPLLNIAEANQVVTLTYIETPSVDPFDVNFMAFGQLFESVQSTGTLVLPATDPVACSDGRVFVGWCTQASYSSPTTAPKFAKAGDSVAEGATFYAVFADQEGEGGEPAAFDGTTGGTFKIYAQAGNTTYYATGTIDNKKITSTTNEAAAGDFVFTPVTGGFTIQTGGKYLTHGSGTNLSLGNNAFTWSVENGTQGTWRVNSSTSGRALVFRAGDYNVFGGYATSNVNGTEYFDVEIGGGAGGASYSNYSTACDHGTGVECIQNSEVSVQKIIRDGQVLILRDGCTYNILGVPVE